ncbi:N-6 DNA methylase [Mediterraneibacter agrestimuris]|uniref:N-6 DNA methylase n=1 Tax=Mediterraneibacter agrestimuris TaxID=2941333 RepID=UPI002040785F|nr:N-6 DNA methylase [Mediterraneibacter agrestimuris]
MINNEELYLYAQAAQHQINNGALEDALRHLLSTSLTSIFPDRPHWIQVHADRSETRLHFLDENNVVKQGFADAVVGKTAIEYEKNLNVQAIFQEGYAQVKEYCAGLYNQGIQVDEIYGILSDTVRWYGYKVTITGKPQHGLYGVNNIVLNQADFIDLSTATELEFHKFELFVNKYLNRVQIYPLEASALVRDFGMDSSFYHRNIAIFTDLVNRAMIEKPNYAELVKRVWQNFVAYLGASDYGNFSQQTYINEFYLVTVAKIICANVINKTPIISDEQAVLRILNGRYFESRSISNLVDYDYFGWLNNEPYAAEIAECAINIQRQLTSYDFSSYTDQDLFGELLAQLANREHRLLLGQEFTPHWVAKAMVDQSLNRIPENEEPRFLDMCCGSGVFLIEAIKAVRERFDIRPDSFDERKDCVAFSCVTGFDIDPLAVMLAKANWVLAMNDLFGLHHGQIVIPIYHADSMFVATPITEKIPEDGTESIVLRFDENEIVLPALLVTPEYKKVYDSFMNRCYNLAMVRAQDPETELDEAIVERLIDNVKRESEVDLSDELIGQLRGGANDLIIQLECMQREGRNGIWYFILSNSYRPGLASHQFNCIVSNPPWLAMSKLADNPYRAMLKTRSEEYGIQPPGASHLHTELASTFLLGAIDKYLIEDGVWYCVMPGSLLSGYNHERLRREEYRGSAIPVSMLIDEIWELPKLTFKNKAIVLGGKKGGNRNAVSINGRVYEDKTTFVANQFVLKVQGRRSAWADSQRTIDVEDLINTNPMIFKQGADVMPRTALFHEFERQANGNWRFEEIVPTSQSYYLINQRKSEEGIELTATDFENEYIYKCLTSKLMSPFYVADPANVIMPGRKENGTWHALQNQDLVLMNVSTRNFFEQIQGILKKSLQRWWEDTINYRGKLSQQNFSQGNWLILSNAGGKNPCAAYISLENCDRSRLIIDQTLYWYLVNSEEEAKYIVGILNSNSLAEAIIDFQPQGEFGQRHIHTLPYKIMPRFDSENPAHQDIVSKTEALIAECAILYTQREWEALLNPNSGSLSSRRKRQQRAIRTLNSYEEYENACKAVLGI